MTYIDERVFVRTNEYNISRYVQQEIREVTRIPLKRPGMDGNKISKPQAFVLCYLDLFSAACLCIPGDMPFHPQPLWSLH